MKKILIFPNKEKKKYAVIWKDNDALMEMTDLLDLEEDNIVLNGHIPNPEDIVERWEIRKAKIKQINKTRNALKMTIEVDCKLLLRRFDKTLASE
jgi:hypothetical protein